MSQFFSSYKQKLSHLPPFPVFVSQRAFFTFFSFFSLFIATLLLGACSSIPHMDVTKLVLPDRQMMMQKNIDELVVGFPIAEMTPLIAERNKNTAAFLIGIAKKESNWGKRVPRSEDGADCYNYWGYRGAGSRGVAMGHACFGSPEEAVGIVGGRIDTLISEYQFDTAEELIVWKCGWSCEGHSSVSVKKWIADVGYYTHQVRAKPSL